MQNGPVEELFYFNPNDGEFHVIPSPQVIALSSSSSQDSNRPNKTFDHDYGSTPSLQSGRNEQRNSNNLIRSSSTPKSAQVVDSLGVLSSSDGPEPADDSGIINSVIDITGESEKCKFMWGFFAFLSAGRFILIKLFNSNYKI